MGDPSKILIGQFETKFAAKNMISLFGCQLHVYQMIPLVNPASSLTKNIHMKKGYGVCINETPSQKYMTKMPPSRGRRVAFNNETNTHGNH